MTLVDQTNTDHDPAQDYSANANAASTILNLKRQLKKANELLASKNFNTINVTTDYFKSNWLMQHPYYHTYPFASIWDTYYRNPWSFYFPGYRRWGYGWGWGFGYGYGCYFCYYPYFYGTPLAWGYWGVYGSYFSGFYGGFLIDPVSVNAVGVVDGAIDGGDFDGDDAFNEVNDSIDDAENSDVTEDAYAAHDGDDM